MLSADCVLLDSAVAARLLLLANADSEPCGTLLLLEDIRASYRYTVWMPQYASLRFESPVPAPFFYRA